MVISRRAATGKVERVVRSQLHPCRVRLVLSPINEQAYENVQKKSSEKKHEVKKYDHGMVKVHYFIVSLDPSSSFFDCNVLVSVA